MAGSPLSTRQPPPIHTDEAFVQPMLADDIRARFTGETAEMLAVAVEERMEHGIREYGIGLQPSNGRDPLIDAIQEQLDGAAYLRQAISKGLPVAGVYERALALLYETTQIWRGLGSES